MSADKWVVAPLIPPTDAFWKNEELMSLNAEVGLSMTRIAMLYEAMLAARPTGPDVPVLVDRAELEALRAGDTCGRQCEGTAYRIELGQAKREIERLRTRVAELERALGPALTREAEDMGLYDEDRADTIGQNGNEGLHYKDENNE